MKLGTATGSLLNNLLSRAIIGEPRPVVGMGCTLLGWTDRHAATIQKVEEIGGSKVTLYVIEVTLDNVKVIGGSMQDGSAEYEYTPRPGGMRITYRKNKKTGFWEKVRRNPVTGKWCKTNGKGLRIGERDEYHDPSF